MDRRKIRQALQIFLQLDQVDLNKEAKHLKQQISKDKKALETARDDLEQTYKKAEAQHKKNFIILQKLTDKASSCISAIDKNKKISPLKKKKLGVIAKDSLFQINNVIKIYTGFSKKIVTFKKPKKKLNAKVILGTLNNYEKSSKVLLKWVAELSLGVSSFIPTVGNFISALELMLKLLNKPSGTYNYNRAVEHIAKLMIIFEYSFLYHETILPATKLNFKDFKFRLEANMKISQQMLSDVQKLYDQMHSRMKAV